MAAATESKRQNLMRKELAWLRRGAPARTSKPKFRIDAANELIANEPPVARLRSSSSRWRSRGSARTSSTCSTSRSPTRRSRSTTRGDAAPDPATKTVLHELEWRIAPGERTGILGVNGAGKSTLLGLVTGAVQPTTGRVKRGKTVKVATLSQELAELNESSEQRVSAVVAEQRTSYAVGEGSKAELTPGQLLERLGFSNAQLSTPVKDLSGGQKRRLQLLLILLEEPNVLILDEPTNDLDTDMLAAIEDLLDSWPGTLLVVSHDRYLIERVTDQQYAILDGHLRTCPGASSSTSSCAGGSTPRAWRPPRVHPRASRRRPRRACNSAAPTAARPRRSSVRSTASSNGCSPRSPHSTRSSRATTSPTTWGSGRSATNWRGSRHPSSISKPAGSKYLNFSTHSVAGSVTDCDRRVL